MMGISVHKIRTITTTVLGQSTGQIPRVIGEASAIAMADLLLSGVLVGGSSSKLSLNFHPDVPDEVLVDLITGLRSCSGFTTLEILGYALDTESSQALHDALLDDV